MQKQKLNTISAKKKWETRNKINNNEKKVYERCRCLSCKISYVNFYCHYFHNLIPETNEQTGFFLLRMLLEKLGRVRRSLDFTVWKVFLSKVKEVLIYKVPRK